MAPNGTHAEAGAWPVTATTERTRRRDSLWSFAMLREIVREAMNGLLQHRTRALLSMLGISWGIVSVVMLLAYGNGFHGALVAGFKGAFGEGVVVGWPSQTSMQAGGERAGRRVLVKPEDVVAMRDLPFVRAASPEFVKRFPVAFGEQMGTYAIRGVSAGYGEMRSEKPRQGGRFLSAEDVRLHRRVAFIGTDVQKKLFGTMPAVGMTIRIAGQPYDVIGVLADKVQLSSYFSPDKQSVFIPYTTMDQLADTTHVNVFVFQAVTPLLEEKATNEVRQLLAQRYRYNAADKRAVVMDGSEENLQVVNGITNGLKFVLGFIGVLTLMIGGVGIMNIMFVSVTERTREIGIRLSLGARERDVRTQFLIEALVLSLLGGLLGVGAGVGGAIGLSAVLAWPTELSAAAILLAFGFSAAVGIFFGYYPASKASRLDPITALRFE